MADSTDLTNLVDNLAGTAVLCVGDVMLDRFIYGEVDRISPEAPIPVFSIERETMMLGGAGNVVRNLVALGGKPNFVSVVGGDAAGREIVALIGGETGVVPDILVENGRPTTIKTRYIAAGQQMLRADHETVTALTSTTVERTVDHAVAAMEGCAAVVLSDYAKGVLAPAVTARVIEAARQAGRPVVVDPKGIDYAHYRGATLLTPNRRELAEATRMPVSSDDEIVAAACDLIDRIEVDAILVTRGGEGMTLVADGAVHHLPAEALEVFDVSGAGDTVVATVASAMAGGLTLLDAARLANMSAGLVVGKVGTATVSLAELTGALHKHDVLAGADKLVGLPTLLERVAAWREAGHGIGFTNGCFDLLHPGHVSLLAQARAACDRLIVGLNSDASTRRLKGEGRPIQTEAARAAVLSSLASVDAVVVFAEDTPVKLIEAFRPDVLVKGADYKPQEVVGADIVTGYGGRVLLADLAPGHSTTATIARMGR